MTQNEQILIYLKKGKTLTPLQALGKFDCFRLAARVAELRAQGWPISTETVHQHGKTFARYRLTGCV